MENSLETFGGIIGWKMWVEEKKCMKKWLYKLCGKMWWKKLGGQIAWESLVEEFFWKNFVVILCGKIGWKPCFKCVFFHGKLGGTVWWKNLWTKCIGKIRLKL